METIQLGQSDLNITPIGLGTWAIGGGENPYGWGPQDDRDSINTISRALDLGINWLDTAKGYGHGHSEKIVGEAVKNRRHEVIIATKCGILWKEDGSDIYGHLKVDSIKAEAETSLKRLQTDVIDLYQIHWPLPDEDIEEGWQAVYELIEEGKVRYGGICNFSVSQMERIKPYGTITSLQPPYSMIKRDIEEDILPYCGNNNIGVVVYSPMQAGLLTGKVTKERVTELPKDDWRKNDPNFQEPLLTINLNFVDQLEMIANDNSVTLSQLAIAWTLRRSEVTSAIVGARRPDQIEETVKAADVSLEDAIWSEIDNLIAQRDQQASAINS